MDVADAGYVLERKVFDRTLTEMAGNEGADIIVKDFLGRGASCVAGISIQLDCFLCELKSGRPTTSSDHDQLRWVTKDELEDLQWAEADVPIITQLKRYL